MQGCAIIVVMAGLLGADTPAQASKNEKASIQGVWIVESMVFGKEKFAVPPDMKFTFKENDKVILTGGPAGNSEGTFKLDVTKSPKQLDLEILAQDKSVNNELGIYEFKDGKLLIASRSDEFGEINGKMTAIRRAVRPKKFDDASVFLTTLVREKK